MISCCYRNAIEYLAFHCCYNEYTTCCNAVMLDCSRQVIGIKYNGVTADINTEEQTERILTSFVWEGEKLTKGFYLIDINNKSIRIDEELKYPEDKEKILFYINNFIKGEKQ